MADASKFRAWIGHACTSVRRDGHIWRFVFGDSGGVNVECPWRICAGGRITLTDTDHDQKFGLPQPIDAAKRAEEILQSRRIQSIEVHDCTGDLLVRLEGDAVLELWCNSSGYEAWQATVIGDAARSLIVAQGGGEIVVFDGLPWTSS